MTDRYKKQWEALGTDPYWAVLSDPAKKDGKWNKAEFFQTGRDEIESLLAKILDLGVAPKLALALDYGCGVGRLSRALSKSFGRVLGVDISEAMLSEARWANAEFENIQFLCNDGKSLSDVADGSVDFVYSNIVLQHSPRENQRLLIKEFCRVLRPGGVLVFQTPSHENIRTIKGILHLLLGNRVLNIVRRIKDGKSRVMEMHTINRSDVLALLRDAGMLALETERYDAAGIGFVSYRYFSIKHPGDVASGN